MKKGRAFIFAAALVLLIHGGAAGQANQTSHTVTMEVDAIAVLNLTGGNITLSVSAPATGGQIPQDGTDSTCYLQYTSTVPSGQSRTLTVAWGGADTAPAGTSLKVTANPDGGTNEGSSAGQKTVSSSAQVVVNTVGSCFTGTGGTDGANLAYVLSVDTATSLVAGESQQATLTYTLTDAS